MKEETKETVADIIIWGVYMLIITVGFIVMVSTL
jgi:hypothetical protein